MISEADLQKLMKLSFLKVKDLEDFREKLKGVFVFFEELKEVNTKNVPFYRNSENFREFTGADEVKIFNKENELLKCSPQEIGKNQIKLPKIM